MMEYLYKEYVSDTILADVQNNDNDSQPIHVHKARRYVTDYITFPIIIIVIVIIFL